MEGSSAWASGAGGAVLAVCVEAADRRAESVHVFQFLILKTNGGRMQEKTGLSGLVSRQLATGHLSYRKVRDNVEVS